MKKTYIRPMAEAINLNLESPIMVASDGLAARDHTPEDDSFDNILSNQKDGWSSDSWTLND